MPSLTGPSLPFLFLLLPSLPPALPLSSLKFQAHWTASPGVSSSPVFLPLLEVLIFLFFFPSNSYSHCKTQATWLLLFVIPSSILPLPYEPHLSAGNGQIQVSQPQLGPGLHQGRGLDLGLSPSPGPRVGPIPEQVIRESLWKTNILVVYIYILTKPFLWAQLCGFYFPFVKGTTERGPAPQPFGPHRASFLFKKKINNLLLLFLSLQSCPSPK